MRQMMGEARKACEGKEPATTEPMFHAKAFVCPHCWVHAHQLWWLTSMWQPTSGGGSMTGGQIADLSVSYCQACQKYCLWVGKTLVYPVTSTAPMPVDDVPEDVKSDFLEARTVFDRSPRSAAALLRLALQKLLPHLGEKGKDINTDIGNLVRNGLPVKVQQALDTVRLIGNNAVHPGQIDLNDDKETAAALFGLLNFIVERMITHPKQIQALYSSLPSSSREAVEKRDGKK